MLPSVSQGELDFLVGQVVAEVRYADRMVFVAGSRPEPDLYADVGNAEVIDSQGGPITLDGLIGRVVQSASVDPDGTLCLAFNGGASLRCEPDPQYEAWQVVGGDPQTLVVCMPGGELAIWDSRHRVTETEAAESVRTLNALFGWNMRLGEISGPSFTIWPADEHEED
jgi:hypothetical protein